MTGPTDTLARILRHQRGYDGPIDREALGEDR